MRRMKASGAEGQAAARLNELPILAQGTVVFARAGHVSNTELL